MPSLDAITALNRAYIVCHRSLPMYLGYARPLRVRGDERAIAHLDLVVAEQRAARDRLGSALLDLGATIDPGKFPLSFTALNDLALPRIIPRVVQLLRRDISELEGCLPRLDPTTAEHGLVNGVLAASRRHLQGWLALLPAGSAESAPRS